MITVGLDEVGRGAFAGPLVTGCVAIDETIPRPQSIIIRDSKKLSSLQRERAAEWITEHAIATGIGIASPRKIDTLGLTRATNQAFRQAISSVQAKFPIDELLIDAFYVPQVRGIPRRKQQAIIHGDDTVFAIAAASIIAKVYRDALMTQLSQKEQFVRYLWHKNKGYGTKDHREAIQKYGPCKLHRVLFLKKI